MPSYRWAQRWNGDAAGGGLREVKQGHRGQVDTDEEDVASSFGERPRRRTHVAPRLSAHEPGAVTADRGGRAERVIASNHAVASEHGARHSSHLVKVDLTA